jgi:hypothetical protein
VFCRARYDGLLLVAGEAKAIDNVTVEAEKIGEIDVPGQDGNLAKPDMFVFPPAVVTSTSGNGHTSSASTVPCAINWNTRSPRSLAIVRQIGTRVSEGYPPIEIPTRVREFYEMGLEPDRRAA